MYTAVRETTLRRGKVSIPRAKPSIYLLKVLFLALICCVAVFQFIHIFRDMKGYTSQLYRLTDRTTATSPECELKTEGFLTEYSCTSFCRMLERMIDRLERKVKDLDQMNKLRRMIYKEHRLSDEERFQSNAIIVSYKRSGSSFLGEIFNRHPDVFYLYEPLHSLTAVGKEGTDIFRSMARHLLKVIFSCRYAEHPYYVGYSNMGDFRLRSRALSTNCSPTSMPGRTHNCENIDPGSMADICEIHKHVIVKSIRIRNLNIIQSVLRSENAKRQTPNAKKTAKNALQILHLVRDPRAIISSRRDLSGTDGREYQKEESLRQNAKDLCKRMYSNLKQGASRKEWVGRYQVIRYEDVALRPVYAAKELYHYLGIRTLKNIFNWIRTNTNAKEETDSFSTTKNATASINKWKLKFDLKTIRTVEGECKDVMQALGYCLIGDQPAGFKTDTETFSESQNDNKGIFVTAGVHEFLGNVS